MSETITLRFLTETDPVSAAIRYDTWSPFSHVEFILDDGTTLGARAEGGVAIRPINYIKVKKEERYAIPVTADQKAAILAYAHAQVGKPYDFKLIVGDLFHANWRDDGKWDCSGLVTGCFEQGNVPLLHVPAEQIFYISPGQVYISPLLLGNELPTPYDTQLKDTKNA